jgi:hypothetical protein
MIAAVMRPSFKYRFLRARAYPLAQDGKDCQNAWRMALRNLNTASFPVAPGCRSPLKYFNAGKAVSDIK